MRPQLYPALEDPFRARQLLSLVCLRLLFRDVKSGEQKLKSEWYPVIILL